MAGGRTFVIRLITDSKQTEAAFQRVGVSGAAFNKSMILAGAALGALMTGMKQAVSAAIEYDKTLLNLTTQIGMTQESAQALGNQFLTMTDLRTGPQELADAFYFIASAGLEGAAAMEAMEYSAKAAALGMGEAEVIADLLTTVMGSYGSKSLSAARATDILLYAVRNGKAEASEMASAMGAVVPIAANMGVQFEDVAAALAVLTNRGATAADATTQLRSFLVGLLNPSKEAETALNAMGLSTDELRRVMAGPEGLFGALMMIQEATGGSADKFADITGRVEALNFLSGILGGNLQETAALFGATEEALGSVDRAFIESGQTVSGQIDLMKAQWQSLLIDIGQAPTGGIASSFKFLNTALYELRYLMAGNATEAQMTRRTWEQAAGAYDAARNMLVGLSGAQREAAMQTAEYQAYVNALDQAYYQLISTGEVSRLNQSDINQLMREGVDVSNSLSSELERYLVTTDGLGASAERWNAQAAAYGAVAGAAAPLFDVTSLLKEEYDKAAAAAQTFADNQLLAVSPMLQVFDASDRLKVAKENLTKATSDTSTSEEDLTAAIGRVMEAQARYDAALIAATPVLDTFREDVIAVMNDEFGLTQEQINGVIDYLGELEAEMNRLDGMRATMYVDIVTSGSFPSGASGSTGGDVRQMATGGPVMQGTPYIVGEQGPELFVPNVSGTIIPNDRMSNFNVPVLGGSDGGIVINVEGAIDPEGTARTILRVLQDAERRTGARL